MVTSPISLPKIIVIMVFLPTVLRRNISTSTLSIQHYYNNMQSLLQPYYHYRTFSTATHSSFSEPVRKKSLITGNESVHSTMKVSQSWRNKPLFRRQGDVRFKTGIEAGQLLIKEAMRRDSNEIDFINAVTSNIICLSPIFERNPKYAFIAKTLLEPDRLIQFRVAWTDDMGVIRMNRGYRIQYNNSIGHYCGSLHFSPYVNNGMLKALGFDTVFSNALIGSSNNNNGGLGLGSAVGGADFNPLDKSEGELQRFCQSYITELSKYIEPKVDIPLMGMGVSSEEMGYLFGHYKRINPKAYNGESFLSGTYPEVSLNNLCFFFALSSKKSNKKSYVEYFYIKIQNT